jgi:hypothetical protein
MINWRRVMFWVILFTLVYTAPTEGEGKPITVDIYPRVALAGLGTAEVRIGWRIERHPDNRKYSFVMSSTNGAYNLVEGELHGEESQITFPTYTADNTRPRFRTVSMGYYVFEACVYRKTNGKEVRHCADQKLEVK